MYVCMCVCVYIYIHVCMCVCMYVCMYVHIYTHTHTSISARLGPDLVCGNAAAEYGIRTVQSAARRCSNQGLYVGEQSTFEVGGVWAPPQ